ncbi:insulin-degrading enzyme, putative [Ichthyophthirius multifiliis]|uniref:Insulin-degrading enzyme, putative n=1 Tax=Ichthyophthirius multifiliis TaxID=5932 RepID=G0QT47_ICHMU|nr:insulin-degrading enzyme, putative [Ichthyophthirius multifiliis]EGR31622.1 insulin-degrading enzyme, putative [Ichthyophthirius multifiliis]|eukprot:XP_004035108.1 insulin-degrading enzyme, putative [Ichthyophthirius multifiliis]
MIPNTETKIEKSPNDNREYLGFTLKNGIKVIVISDKETDKSAVSLDIHIGQLEDPRTCQGIAHFCEHMLFMGTKKYPIQNEFSQFLNQNSGSDNAYTDMMNTNYYYDIKNDQLQNSLDRFSQFFIEPLFDETCVEKEIQAIESEHQLGLNDDSNRHWEIFKSLSEKNSNFNQYGGGCLETLQKPTIRQDLIDFYEKYYSSNLMNLVIYGVDDIQILQKWAIDYFQEIPNKNIQRPIYQDHPFLPYDKYLGKLINIIPVLDEDTIEFCWIVDYFLKEREVKSEEYLQHIFGHEGENSLLSLLIDEGYASEIVSFGENCMGLFSYIGIQITLTSYGFDNWDKVCHVVFQMVEVLKKEGAREYIYEEIKETHKINFRFLEKIAKHEYVTKIADEMHHCKDIGNVLKNKYQFKKFNKNLIEKLINSLNMENLLIFLSTQQYEQDEDEQDVYFGAKYKVNQIPDNIKKLQQIKYVNHFSTKKLGLPLQNKFIPKNFDLLEIKNEQKYPILVYQSQESELYYKQDDFFKICKIYGNLQIFTNDCSQGKSVKAEVLGELWLELLQYYINETRYQAETAHINIKLEQTYTAFQIKFNGYSDSMHNLLQEFFKLFLKYDPEKQGERIFKIYYEKLENDYKNFYRDSPYKICQDLLKICMISDGKYSLKQKLNILKKLKFQDIIDYNKSWLQNYRMRWLLMGNISLEQSFFLVKYVEQCMKQLRLNNQILQLFQIPTIKCNKLNSDNLYLLEYHVSKKFCNMDETNSSFICHFQKSIETLEQRVYMQLLHNYLSEPLFNQLRTNDQLGYIVDCWEETFRSVSGMSFLIQSSTFCPIIVSEKLESFLVNINLKLKNLQEQEFNEFKHSVGVKLTEKFQSLSQEFKFMRGEILIQQYIFNRKELVSDVLQNISVQNFIEFYQNLFFNERKLIEIHFICINHINDQKLNKEKYKEQRKITQLKDDQMLKDICNQNNQFYD